MQMGLMSILMLLLSGSGNELLDYVPTESYWKAKDVVVDVATITKELEGINADDASKANAIRKLMGIRTLGELKDNASIAALQKHLDSKELFVTDYARRAIANIEGKPRPMADGFDPKASRPADLSMLPTQCGAVAQITMRGGGTVDLKKALEGMPGGAEQKEEALNKVVQQVIDLAEQIGNVRLDNVTLGLGEEVGERQGFFVLYARGLYDPEALKAILPANMQVEAHNDIEFRNLGGDGASLAMPSGQLLVLVAGASPTEVPTEEVSMALKDGKGKLAENEELAKLIEPVDKTADIWSVVRISSSYRQAPVFASFDSMQLIGKQSADKMEIEVKATGQDADVVKTGVEQLTALIEEGKNQLSQNQQADPNAAPAEAGAADTPAHNAMQPLVDFLGSIQTKTDGNTAIITGTLKGSSATMLLLPMMLGM